MMKNKFKINLQNKSGESNDNLLKMEKDSCKKCSKNSEAV